MRLFPKGKTAPISTGSTPAEQLEQIRAARREAKAEFDSDFHELRCYYETHPPARRPFLVDEKYYFQPVNTLAAVPPEQRRLEDRVTRSRQRWAALQRQEATLEFTMGLKR